VGLKRTNEFRQNAAWITLTSGLTRKQVADDLGVGMSTANKWITALRNTDVVPREDLDLVRENDRLRRENRLLKEERDIPKKATQFVEQHRDAFPAVRLCYVIDVSMRGLRVYRIRTALPPRDRLGDQ
jgi:transposase